MRISFHSVFVSAALLIVGGLATSIASAADVTTSTQVVDFSGFTGGGFAPSPAAGQLDSDHWRVTGFDTADFAFSGASTTGDHARGASAGGETTGGIYGFDISNGGTVDRALGVQPGSSDFTPGTMELRLTNNTGADLFSINLSYDVYALNNTDRANSIDFSFTNVGGLTSSLGLLNFTSSEAADGAPAWASAARSAQLVFTLPLADGQSVDLIWTGDDVSGSGSRDEFALDNVQFAGNAAPTGTVLAEDNFDGATTFATRSISPDNSGSTPPGSFTTDPTDVFGVVDRTVNSDFNGAIPVGKTDNFFGVEDLQNDDNLGGTGVATWTANISGATELTLAVDIWSNAGNFEGTDVFEFSYSIDGAPAQTAFLSSNDSSLAPQDLLINGIALDEAEFQTFFAGIDGIGDLLSITFNAQQNADGELFGFDNLQLLGTAAVVPEPASIAIWLLLGVTICLAAARRRRT